MHPTIHIWGTPGNYQTYCRALLHIGGIPCVCKSLAPLCSVLLLPGGGDLEPWRYGQKNTSSRGLEPERDCAEFELIARYLNLRRPILGICRGMQVLNVFFGGTLLQDLPGHSQIQGQDRFHFVQTFPSAFAQLYPPLSIVNSAHHQAVDPKISRPNSRPGRRPSSRPRSRPGRPLRSSRLPRRRKQRRRAARPRRSSRCCWRARWSAAAPASAQRR